MKKKALGKGLKAFLPDDYGILKEEKFIELDIEQLKPNGRMILPLGSPYGTQTLVLVTKNKKGKVRSKSLLPVRFVPMLGRITEPESQRRK